MAYYLNGLLILICPQGRLTKFASFIFYTEFRIKFYYFYTYNFKFTRTLVIKFMKNKNCQLQFVNKFSGVPLLVAVLTMFPDRRSFPRRRQQTHSRVAQSRKFSSAKRAQGENRKQRVNKRSKHFTSTTTFFAFTFQVFRGHSNNT